MKKCRIKLDSGYRLSSVSVNGVQVHSYTFDANGNRTLADGQVAAFAADDRLMQYNGTQYSYDGNGALASVVSPSGTAQFRYDTRGNLLQAQTVDGKKISYRIDARDRRVAKSVDGVPTEGFLYQDQLEPIAWLDGQGNIRATFVYGDRAHVPAYMEMAGKCYRYVVDHLGSVRQVVDAATGAVVQEIDYDVWGAETRNTNPGFQPFGFAGGITDRHTGLVRFGARDYDPATGRWTSKDPVRFSGGWNLYVYAGNDPVNWIDVSGYGPMDAMPSPSELVDSMDALDNTRDEKLKTDDVQEALEANQNRNRLVAPLGAEITVGVSSKAKDVILGAYNPVKTICSLAKKYIKQKLIEKFKEKTKEEVKTQKTPAQEAVEEYHRRSKENPHMNHFPPD